MTYAIGATSAGAAGNSSGGANGSNSAVSGGGNVSLKSDAAAAKATELAEQYKVSNKALLTLSISSHTRFTLIKYTGAGGLPAGETSRGAGQEAARRGAV